MGKIRCCICNKIITHRAPDFGGNNPDPMSTKENDRCCNECNDRYVILARCNPGYIGELWKVAKGIAGYDKELAEIVERHYTKLSNAKKNAIAHLSASH